MFLSKILSLGLFVSFTILSFGQENFSFQESACGLVENKGQIRDQNQVPNHNVKYILSLPFLNVQFRASGIGYDSYKVRETGNNKSTGFYDESVTGNTYSYNFHRVDIEFVGANDNCIIKAENQSDQFYNFFLSGSRIEDIHAFSKITYCNLYPGIDLEFLCVKNQLKYNFILSE